MEVQPIKKKRGRKSKKELELLKKLEKEKENEKKVPKKRGRKPKGGKIVSNEVMQQQTNTIIKENIILHLKCTSNELEEKDNLITNLLYNPTIQTIDPYNKDDTELNLISNNVVEQEQNSYTLHYDSEVISNNNYENTMKIQNKTDHSHPDKHCTYNNSSSQLDDHEIWRKIKELNISLHQNKVSDRKSSCFWCSCEFSNPPIYIPKSYINDTYEVYGSFCMPECAVGFLFKENIDNTTRWERYAMMNSIYSSIFNYEKNIKPAPEPYYILDKFYGTLSIEEFRHTMRKDKLLMVVDKPLTRILPELYEDNNEFNIGTNSASSKKFRLSREKKKPSKHEVNFFNHA